MRASLALQRALARALEMDGVLGTAGLRLLDGPPADAVPPYAMLSAETVSARHWAGGGGTEHRFQLSLWDGGRGLAGSKQLMGEVERVVLAMARGFEGFQMVSLRLLSAEARTNPRHWTEGRLTFRALLVEDDYGG